MDDNLLEELKKRLDCLILLSCLSDSSEKEKFRVATKCLGVGGVAKLLGKDPSNFSKYVNNKWIKKGSRKNE